MGYRASRRRLLVLGYNATLTTTNVEAPHQPKRHYDQLKSESQVNPKVCVCVCVNACVCVWMCAYVRACFLYLSECSE